MKIVRILMVLIVGMFLGPAISDGFAMADMVVHPAVGALGYTALNVGMSLLKVPLPTDILMFNVGDVLRSDSASNPSGLKVLGYYAYVADFDNIPGLAASPATSAERISLESTTGFTFLTGKCWNQVSIELETGEVISEPIGEKGGQNYMNKATIFISGTNDDVTAVAAELKNSHTIWALPEQSGDVKIIGSEEFPATCKCTLNSGKGSEDRRGLTVEIEAASPDPAYKYAGTLSTTPAT